MISFGFFIEVFVGVLYFILLPFIYLAKGLKAKNTWVKIIPPIITMGISILFIIFYALNSAVSPYYFTDGSTGSMVKSYLINNSNNIDRTPFTLLRMFVFYNIPTWIMLIGYFLHLKNIRHRDEVVKMKIRDIN